MPTLSVSACSQLLFLPQWPQDPGVRLALLVYLAECLLAALSESLRGKGLFGGGRWLQGRPSRECLIVGFGGQEQRRLCDGDLQTQRRGSTLKRRLFLPSIRVHASKRALCHDRRLCPHGSDRSSVHRGSGENISEALLAAFRGALEVTRTIAK
jgi:hypothetical protein